jgi:hypothetical protein
MICLQTYVPNPPCQLSRWEENRSTRRKPTTFGRALTFTLFTWGLVSSHIEKFSLRFDPAALEVKCKCANHFATEAPYLYTFYSHDQFGFNLPYTNKYLILYFYSDKGTTDDSRRIIIITTTVGAGVFLSIVLIVLLIKYKRLKRARNLSSPINIPLETNKISPALLPFDEVNYLWSSWWWRSEWLLYTGL